jgi:peptidoglycan L-alanyl-D-glutamate endopeptidase CwlK
MRRAGLVAGIVIVGAIVLRAVHPKRIKKMGKFRYSRASLDKLSKIDDRLRMVMERALELSDVDITIVQGLRSKEEQEALVRAGKSRATVAPKHVIGHAVDVAAYVNGSTNWQWENIFPIALAVKNAANELGVTIRWGGVWDRNLNDLSDDLPYEIQAYRQRYRAKNPGKFPLADGGHFEIVEKA